MSEKVCDYPLFSMNVPVLTIRTKNGETYEIKTLQKCVVKEFGKDYIIILKDSVASFLRDIEGVSCITLAYPKYDRYTKFAKEEKLIYDKAILRMTHTQVGCKYDTITDFYFVFATKRVKENVIREELNRIIDEEFKYFLNKKESER